MAGIYIHIPFCEKKCRYCDFYSITDFSYIDNYINALIQEINLFANNYNSSKISSIFIGGGTPSVLKNNHIELIINSLTKNFDFAENIEFSIESNPKTLNYKDLLEYRKMGINRLSIGIQSLNANELTFLGRIHNASEALKSIKDAQDAGFDNINVDIIFAIPGQTIKTLLQTLHQIIDSDVNHISAYSLIYENGTPLYNDYIKKKFKVTNEEEDFELYNLLCETLNGSNFNHYEISNFSKQNTECKHNLTYWQKQEYYGFGTAAHSFYDKKRVSNISNIKQYIELINQSVRPIDKIEILLESEVLIEEIFLGLRATGLNINELSNKISLSRKNSLQNFINKSVIENIGYMQNNIFKLTDKGFFICDEIVLNILDIIE